MYSGQVTIINKTGLHARPAADFVKEALKFKSSINIAKAGRPDEKVNAKSIVLVLSLSVANNERIEITAEGEDEQKAVQALIEIVNTGFGE